MNSTQKHAIETLAVCTRRLKPIPGSVLLIDLIRRFFLTSPHLVNMNDFDRAFRLRLRLCEHMQSQIFWFGYYSRDIVKVFDSILKPGMIVFDVGSNLGEIGLCASRRVGQSGKVFCFEPMSDLYESLVENIRVNGASNITAVNMGLSTEERRMTIFRSSGPFRDGSIHDGLGTFYPTSTRNIEAGVVEVQRLDKFCLDNRIDRIDVLKIDVEGSELDVLRGASNCLKAFKPHVIVEVQSETSAASGSSPSEILNLLSSYGYVLYHIGRHGKLRALDTAPLLKFQNVLAVPRKA